MSCKANQNKLISITKPAELASVANQNKALSLTHLAQGHAFILQRSLDFA